MAAVCNLAYLGVTVMKQEGGGGHERKGSGLFGGKKAAAGPPSATRTARPDKVRRADDQGIAFSPQGQFLLL